MKRISLKDVAREAGISTSTVSFILNGRAGEMRISKDLEKRVQVIAAKLGYVPNQVAVSLRTGQSKMIGLIVESISGHFFGLLAKIIEDEAEKAGYKLLYSSTENRAQRGIEILKMFSQQQVDGYLITPAKGMEKEITNIAKNNKPLVLIDSYFPSDSISHVLVDNYKGMMMGMGHLFDKGYKNIGFVTVDLPLVQIEERKMAFTNALKSRKVKKITDQVLEIPYNSPGEEIVKRVKNFIHARPGMDAIFFATNYLGIHGLECIQQLGLQMPADIAMICFDDHDLFRLFPKGITAIQQPIDEIAKKAIGLLIKQLEKGKSKKQTCEQVKLAPSLIKRGSS
ncbi:MAG TPA: LacI family DNA-binding transcriptional regulator [Chitinophagaceae bacterium]|nr:LacI family DNA-binding transcriptional regulator [Chitinophagaceae bacterium]